MRSWQALPTGHRGDARQHGLSGVQVLGARVAVQLVLQRVLDLRLELLGDVVPVGTETWRTGHTWHGSQCVRGSLAPASGSLGMSLLLEQKQQVGTSECMRCLPATHTQHLPAIHNPPMQHRCCAWRTLPPLQHTAEGPTCVPHTPVRSAIIHVIVHLCAMSRMRVRGTLCVKRSVKDGSRLCSGVKWVVAGQAYGQPLCQGMRVCKDATGELRRQLSNCWHCARRQNCAKDGRGPPAGGGPPAPPPGWRGPARQSPTPETCAGQEMLLLNKKEMELPIHLD